MLILLGITHLQTHSLFSESVPQVRDFLQLNPLKASVLAQAFCNVCNVLFLLLIRTLVKKHKQKARLPTQR